MPSCSPIGSQATGGGWAAPRGRGAAGAPAATRSAREVLALSPRRWSIERLFFDLKEVLNLHRVYAGNPNAVAMQVYAAGCVYNAMRVAQGEVAAAAGVPPQGPP